MDDGYQTPKSGKTYISPSLKSFGDKERRVRIASKVLPSEDGYEYARERDEVVLRKKPDAATHIKAKFLEDTRQVFVLTVQKFMTDSGMPYGSGFSFVGDEIGKFCEFLSNIQSVRLQRTGSINITDEELRRIALTTHQARHLVSDNEELFSEVLRYSLTKKDVVAVGYRKQQLETFHRLLSDPGYFEEVKRVKKCSDESLWQKFFEKNQWIFGYGLDYIYSSSLDDKRLEQVVRGHHVGQSGKRVDALLKSRAIASSLCFVEMKNHRTPLLQGKPYRAACWAPSDELAGAVAQIHGTVSYASETIAGKLRVSDSAGFPTPEEIFNFKPKSFVVLGHLGQFANEHGINEEQFRSFELYRGNMVQPEIVTFDELYERARHIVAANES